MMIEEIFDKIGRIIPSEKSKLEIEVRFFIDERKKTDVFSKKYTPDQTQEIVKKLITKYEKSPTSISQTINFIAGDKIKQMTFINGEQRKDLVLYYKKQKIINPITLLHNDLPAYRFAANFETTIDEFSVSNANLARIRLRYTILINKDWQLDITLIKQITDFSNPIILKTAKTTMLFPIDASTFINKAPWDKAELIEIELEYIGKQFKLDDLQLANTLFEFLNESEASESPAGVAPGIGYQDAIWHVAKLIRPRDANKFRHTDGLKQLSNQVIELDKNMFLKRVLPSILNYYITDKIDGARAVLYITDGTCYVITKSLRQFAISSSNKNVYVLDCEEITTPAGLEYYIFDVMVYESKPVVSDPFESRMALFDELAALDTALHTKPFEKLTSNFQEQIRKFKTRTTTYEVDGIILTPADADYQTMQVYKYKPIDRLSIDFVIKKCPDKLLGIEPYIKKDDQVLYLLFCGMRQDVFKQLGLSFVKHYEDIFPGIDTKRVPKYFPYQFQPSNFTFAYLYWDKNPNLDGEVGEFVCNPCILKQQYKTTDDLWHLHKIRADRKVELARGNYYGNYYKVAELSWMSYKDPLIIEDLDLTQRGYFQEHDNALQRASRNFNSFVKAKIIEQVAGAEHVLDLASGKGQDLFRYAANKFKNAVFLEIDNTALLELTARKFDIRDAPPINIQIHQLDLTADYKENITTLDDILIEQHSMDVIICNFAFHYLLESRKSLLNIAKFIDYYLKSGGRFIFTAFDGAAVIRLLNENSGEWTVKKADQIKYSIKRRYKMSVLEHIGQKIDVLLPFSNLEYYSEYLVNIDYIAEEFGKLGFTLEINESFDEHLAAYKKQNLNGYNLMDADDKKYSGLYHHYCLYKKKAGIRR